MRSDCLPREATSRRRTRDVTQGRRACVAMTSGAVEVVWQQLTSRVALDISPGTTRGSNPTARVEPPTTTTRTVLFPNFRRLGRAACGHPRTGGRVHGGRPQRVRSVYSHSTTPAARRTSSNARTTAPSRASNQNNGRVVTITRRPVSPGRPQVSTVTCSATNRAES